MSAHVSLADVEARTGNAEKMLAVLERGVGAVPESAELQYRLADLRSGRENRPGARDVRQDHRAQPGARDGQEQPAYLLAEHGGDLDRALELAQQAKEAMSDDGNAADALGWVLLKRGLPSAAIGYLEEATERFPETAYEIKGLVHNHLAEAYEANQDKDKAIEASRATVGYFERLAKAASERGMAASTPIWVDDARPGSRDSSAS